MFLKINLDGWMMDSGILVFLICRNLISIFLSKCNLIQMLKSKALIKVEQLKKLKVNKKKKLQIRKEDQIYSLKHWRILKVLPNLSS